MLSLWQFLLLLLVAFGVVFIAWRYISERVTLPCPPWLAFLVELDNPLFRNNRAATIIAGLDVKPGMRVLDVGCGPGRLTIPFLIHRCLRIIGIPTLSDSIWTQTATASASPAAPAAQLILWEEILSIS